MTRFLIAAAACALLAGCSQADGNEALAEADASGNEAAVATENALAGATPLQREQALALMKERHDNYEKIGDAMKVIGRELKGDSPDLAAVRSNADTIALLAPQAASWFPAGTGPEAGKTHAKAEIWQKPEDFKAKADDFSKAALAFQSAARGTDVAAMRTAQADLGKSCKACHDSYRSKVD